MAFFGIAAVTLCVAMLIVVTSLFNGFIDAFMDHMQRMMGDVVLEPGIETTDHEELARYLEKKNWIVTARPVTQVGALLYIRPRVVKAVDLMGIDLERQGRDEKFRRGLLRQGNLTEKPSFALSETERQKAKAWLQKKRRRQITDEEVPTGAIVSIGVLAQPDEQTDEYDRQDIIRINLSERDGPMIITTGKRSADAPDAADEGDMPVKKISSLCWPVDVVQTGMHEVDTRVVYLPFDYVKNLVGKKGEDGKIRCHGVVQIITKEGTGIKGKNSWLLTADDIEKPTDLITKIKHAKDPFSKYLRGELCEQTLKMLEEYSGSESPSEELVDGMIVDLNRILKNQPLYEKNILDHIKLSRETEKLVIQYQNIGYIGRIYLQLFGGYSDVNRLLIEDAYPQEIMKKMMVPRVRQAWDNIATEKLGWSKQQSQWARIYIATDEPGVRQYTQAIRQQLFIMQLILGLICLVAALLIFVVMFMMVMQKKKDIGIIRSLGSSGLSVAQIFLMYGGGIGLAGAVLGLGLGVWATHNINTIERLLATVLGFKIWKSGVYIFSEIPNEVAWGSVGGIMLAGVAAALLGALLPARRAARMLPAEALRWE